MPNLGEIKILKNCPKNSQGQKGRGLTGTLTLFTDHIGTL